MIRFNDDSLRHRIRALDKPGRLVFAVACAERAFGPYRYYAQKSRRGKPLLLRSTLNSLWALAEQRQIGCRLPFLDEGDRLIPLSVIQSDEEIEARTVYQKPHKLDCIADDAICSLLYACHCELQGDVQSAYAAADRDLELVCKFAMDFDKRTKRRIDRILARRRDISLSDSLAQVSYVQEELQQHIVDLQDLIQVQGSEAYPHIVKRLRGRARRRARALQNVLRSLIEG